jgi:hypothetical protein
MEEIDMEMPPVRAAGKRPVPSRSESSVGNGYLAIHDAESSGRVEPNAIVPRASGQTAYGTFAVRMPGEVPGKYAKMEDKLMKAEAARMRRILEESTRSEGRAIAGIRGKWQVVGGSSTDTEMVV